MECLAQQFRPRESLSAALWGTNFAFCFGGYFLKDNHLQKSESNSYLMTIVDLATHDVVEIPDEKVTITNSGRNGLEELRLVD